MKIHNRIYIMDWIDITDELTAHTIYEDYGLMLEITTPPDQGSFTYIKKEDAIKLIKHLTQQFNICIESVI